MPRILGVLASLRRPSPVRISGGRSECGKSAARWRVQEGERAGEAARFSAGFGTLYVDPKTLPEGPFLAYDHAGKLVSTIYMIPLKDLDAQKAWNELPAPGGNVDHVSVYYNAGHPGVPDPHYHIVLWHVSKAQEQLVAK